SRYTACRRRCVGPGARHDAVRGSRNSIEGITCASYTRPVIESSLCQFRDLIREELYAAPAGFGDELLLPWVQQHPEIVADLRDIGRPESHARVIGRDEDLLEGLYALSRLVDILIAPHQPVNDGPELRSGLWWTGPLPATTAW